MPLLLAAKVWHYWISVFLLVPIALITFRMIVGYFTKVRANRYPRR
ncbi:MAG: hypothetical protein ACR2H3_15695 [Acidimicrobiales bacterium]